MSVFIAWNFFFFLVMEFFSFVRICDIVERVCTFVSDRLKKRQFSGFFSVFSGLMVVFVSICDMFYCHLDSVYFAFYVGASV